MSCLVMAARRLSVQLGRIVFLCLLSPFIFAQPGSYLERQDTQAFISEMVKDHGFDKAYLREVFAKAEKQQYVLDAISRPAEKRLDWKAYRKIFMTEKRIIQGGAFIEEHKETLARAERELGVSRYVIAAIIGVETYYGGNKGKSNVISALSTLAFDYAPRSKFFRKELQQALLLSREQGFDPNSLKGSYAGAMGYGQFIPSSYRHYAVDFDGDQVADILDNVTDAIGSVANYFKKHGWRSGEPVAFPVTVKGDDYKSTLHNNLKHKHRLSELVQAGVVIPNNLDQQQKGKLLELSGASGTEHWLTLHNFYVITRYNHSHLYGMAVFQLAEKLKENDSTLAGSIVASTDE